MKLSMLLVASLLLVSALFSHASQVSEVLQAQTAKRIMSYEVEE